MTADEKDERLTTEGRTIMDKLTKRLLEVNNKLERNGYEED